MTSIMDRWTESSIIRRMQKMEERIIGELINIESAGLVRAEHIATLEVYSSDVC